MFKEIQARLKYNLLCLIAVDGSWSMGADLVGSVFPWAGSWVNENGVFKTFSEIK